MTTSNEFVQMINHPNYEMSVEYPHTIRRIDNKHEISEWERNGYMCVNLKDDIKRKCYKHRLIAEQFIPNPDNLSQIDHINHNRKDNRIDNLRWVSASMNLSNKSSYKSVRYEFIDDIPEDAVVVDFYETKNELREFDIDKYYYYYNEESAEDVFYARISENVYKILHIDTRKDDVKVVHLKDANNRKVSVVIKRFKYQHDLL